MSSGTVTITTSAALASTANFVLFGAVGEAGGSAALSSLGCACTSSNRRSAASIALLRRSPSAGAHLRLSGQPEKSTELFIKRYGASLDHRLLDQIVGIEIMRRLIGVAQLPLHIGLEDKAMMLAHVRDLVLGSAK